MKFLLYFILLTMSYTSVATNIIERDPVSARLSSILDINGKEFSFDKLEDNVLVVHFWATWCPFCKRDFSIVKNVYPKYADKVTFLAIDLDTSETAQYIQQYKDSMRLDGIDFAIWLNSYRSSVN